MTTTETTTVITTNLSWGWLSAASLEAVKFWLGFIADVWMGATHGSEEVEEVYQTVLATLGKMEGYRRTESEVDVLFEAFDALAEALTGLNQNPVDISAHAETGLSGRKMTLGWYGAFTGGRYLMVSYQPMNYPTVFVEWDTGTGEESTFLALPSTAEQFADGDPEAKLRPVVNHRRIACQKLGIDVSDIPERGYDGVSAAKRALQNLVDNAVQAALGEARRMGHPYHG